MTFSYHHDNVTSVRWLSDTRFVTCSIDRSLALYDLTALNGEEEDSEYESDFDDDDLDDDKNMQKRKKNNLNF